VEIYFAEWAWEKYQKGELKELGFEEGMSEIRFYTELNSMAVDPQRRPALEKLVEQFNREQKIGPQVDTQAIQQKLEEGERHKEKVQEEVKAKEQKIVPQTNDLNFAPQNKPKKKAKKS